MSGHPLDRRVSATMREAAQEVVLPHFRTLSADQIIEKEPGDLVTVADRLTEERLTVALTAILPGSRVVGEEAVAADPQVLDGVDRGAVWILDPIDGTGNYAAGRAPFAIMVALADGGVVEAGWILDPLTGRMLHAVLGRGAFSNGERVHARETGEPLPVAAVSTRFLPPGAREDVEARTAGRVRHVEVPFCAGEQYPRVVLGQNDFALFWRTLPWDHAPGALFLTEAGGRIARPDGTPYSIADRGTGLIAAASPAMWDRAAAMLGG